MESTLFQVQSLFYQGAYQGCIELAISSTSNVRSSDAATVSTLLYAARSHLARSPCDPASALALLSSLSTTQAEPHLSAVSALARFMQSHIQSDADGTARELVNLTELLDHATLNTPTGQTIRCAAATALFLDGDAEEALNTLSVTGTGGSQELECVALGVHILLSLNRLDLAEKEYLAARAWANDSLLIQLIEAWIGLAKGGRASQQAFYVYDELAQNPTAADTQNAVPSLIGKATALAANMDFNNAIVQLENAAKFDANHAEILANTAALRSHTDPPTSEAVKRAYDQLAKNHPLHPLVNKYNALETQFDSLAQRFSLGGVDA